MQLGERALHEEFVKGDGEPNRSDLIRVLLDYGLANMPQYWRPPPMPRRNPEGD